MQLTTVLSFCTLEACRDMMQRTRGLSLCSLEAHRDEHEVKPGSQMFLVSDADVEFLIAYVRSLGMMIHCSLCNNQSTK